MRPSPSAIKFTEKKFHHPVYKKATSAYLESDNSRPHISHPVFRIFILKITFHIQPLTFLKFSPKTPSVLFSSIIATCLAHLFDLINLIPEEGYKPVSSLCISLLPS